MQIIPHSKHDWLRFLMFPFKAYACNATILFFFFIQFRGPRHTHLLDALAFLLLGSFLDAAILLLAALLFSLFGPKGHALSCCGFAVSAFVLAVLIWRLGERLI
jgi:hypothetical protein